MEKSIKINKSILLATVIFLFNATIFCFLIYPKIDNKINLNFDGEGYQKIAFNILSNKGFIFDEGDDSVLSSNKRHTLLRTPLYPYFISFVYYIFGFKPNVVIIFHIIINSFMIYFIYRIAKEVFNEKTAILSSIICAFYLPFIWLLSRVYNENLFTFLLICSLFFVVKVFYDLSLRNSIILGILVGISSLCKGQMIVFPFVLLPGLIYIYRKEKIKLYKRFSMIIISLLLTISPWIIRNYIVSGKFVPVQYGAGIHFMRGNESAKMYFCFSSLSFSDAIHQAFAKEEQAINRFETLHNRNITEVELDEVFKNIAFNNIKDNPLEFLEKIFIGCFHFWYLGENKIKSLGLAILQFPLIIFAIFGFYFAYKKKIMLIIPLYSIILFFMLIHAVIQAIFRYSIPIMPYVLIFASFGIINLYNKLKCENSDNLILKLGEKTNEKRNIPL